MCILQDPNPDLVKLPERAKIRMKVPIAKFFVENIMDWEDLD